MMRPGHNPATVTREIINPLRAVMRLAAKRKWCDAPDFEVPREIEGRTLYLMPDEAERLIAAASPHLRPLLIFLIGTGARMGEAMALNWDERSIDLTGAPGDLLGRHHKRTKAAYCRATAARRCRARQSAAP